MRNCKDCLHVDVCTWSGLFEDASKCKHFKDKSRYIEEPCEEHECRAMSKSNNQCRKCCAYCDDKKCIRGYKPNDYEPPVAEIIK